MWTKKKKPITQPVSAVAAPEPPVAVPAAVPWGRKPEPAWVESHAVGNEGEWAVLPSQPQAILERDPLFRSTVRREIWSQGQVTRVRGSSRRRLGPILHRIRQLALRLDLYVIDDMDAGDRFSPALVTELLHLLDAARLLTVEPVLRHHD